MSDVSVIGTGAMGSALVEVLHATGAEVTVWNRTTDKAAALGGPRVRVAGSVGEALTASPLTIISVSDHEVTRDLLDSAAADLTGRVVASTSFVTQEAATALGGVVSSAGGAYLDLEIVAGPAQVRSGRGTVLVSGEHAAYEAHHAWFERIGRVTFVGEALSAAYISGLAVSLGYLPMAVGLVQGSRIMELQGMSPAVFRQAVVDLYAFHVDQLLGVIAGDLDPQEAGVGAPVDVMGAWAADQSEALRAMGLDPGMFDALRRLFTAASDAGHGTSDWTGIASFVAPRLEPPTH